MTLDVELYAFRPGVPFGSRPCSCELCVVGAHWEVTHCGCCGRHNEPYSWDNVCAQCEAAVAARVAEMEGP